jgi:hypothetical protein
MILEVLRTVTTSEMISYVFLEVEDGNEPGHRTIEIVFRNLSTKI